MQSMLTCVKVTYPALPPSLPKRMQGAALVEGVLFQVLVKESNDPGSPV